MANKKFDDAELLTDDELEHVAGGFMRSIQFNFKPEIPPHVQELIARQAQEISSAEKVHREPWQ